MGAAAVFCGLAGSWLRNTEQLHFAFFILYILLSLLLFSFSVIFSYSQCFYFSDSVFSPLGERSVRMALWLAVCHIKPQQYVTLSLAY